MKLMQVTKEYPHFCREFYYHFCLKSSDKITFFRFNDNKTVTVNLSEVGSNLANLKVLGEIK